MKHIKKKYLLQNPLDTKTKEFIKKQSFKVNDINNEFLKKK